MCGSGDERYGAAAGRVEAVSRHPRLDLAGVPLWRIGGRVRAERDKPSAGTWPRYVGRVGTVLHMDKASPGDVNYYAGRVYEYAVEFDDRPSRYVWFRPEELVAVATSERHRLEMDAVRAASRAAVKAAGPVPKAEPSIDDAWRVWLNGIYRSFLEGARLAERDVYGGAARLIYERTTERKVDAAIRQTFDVATP